MTPNTYRAEIDGLRALAVLPVILYHAGLAGFEGGFIGVDIFFVISGYLITRIILSDHAGGGFSYRRFYERRARRLMPALFLVIFCSLPFAILWMTPQQFWDYGQSIGYTVVFVANIGLEGETGYFAPRADLFPFLHTWSLSVEEQFYLFFPVLLLLSLRLPLRLRLMLFAGLGAASLTLAQIRSETAPSANFYFLTTRAWELLAGALLAMGGRLDAVDAGLRRVAGWAGLGLIAVGFVTIDSATPFPSVWALLPVLGTVLVIFGACADHGVGRLLSWRPLVLVGLISYPAYLWHQPLFAFARIRSLEPVSTCGYLGLGALSLVLAWLTWRFVETPVRQGQRLSRRQVFAGTGALVFVVAAISVTVDQMEGVPQRFDPRVAEVVRWADDLPARQEFCHSKPGYQVPPESACIHGLEDGPGRVALWGDSHAMVVTEQLGLALAEQGTGLRDLTYRACSPLIDYEGPTVDAECAAHNAAVMQWLEQDRSVEVVILHARWPLLIEGIPFDNGEGGIEGGVLADTPGHGRSVPEQARLVAASVGAMIDRLAASGKRVVLLGGVPEVGWTLPDYMARRIIFGFPDDEVSYPRSAWDARNRTAADLLERLAEAEGVLVVDPSDAICGPGPRCQVTRDRLPLFFDDDHVNSLGARLIAERTVLDMVNAGFLVAP